MSTALFNLNLINIFATMKESGMKVMYHAWLQRSILKVSFYCPKEGAFSSLIVSNQKVNRKYKNAESCIYQRSKDTMCFILYLINSHVLI